MGRAIRLSRRAIRRIGAIGNRPSTPYRHLGIRDGRVVTISDVPLPDHAAPKVYDATGQWVTPGFIETHSHYDAEVIATPSLKESVRHGVTSVLIGSCSISMINAQPEDCSDLFTRVEAALDLKSNPWLNVVTRLSGFVANRFLRGNFRWQTLPAPFTLYLSGLNVNAFEEFSSGELLRDYKDEDAMYAKVDDPAFRKLFKKHVNALFTKGLWHRDFSDCWVVDCPDTSLIGKNFEEIGAVEGKDAVDAYFDLAVQYRNDLRWKTNYGNHRPEIMHKLLASPYTHVGFADSGAHLESIAQYNFPLRLLKYVRDADEAGLPFMSVAEGVNAVTADLADWFGLQAGSLRQGSRADVVIVNPEGLTDELDDVAWAPLEGTSLNRLVKRNDDAVTATIINGRVAYDRVQGFDDELGRERNFGQFLSSMDVKTRVRSTESGLQTA